MKLGIVIDHLDPAKGGAERALADFGRAAEAAGESVEVHALRIGPGAPGAFVPVEVPPSPRGARDALFARRAVESARRSGCDVVVGVRHVRGVDVYWPHGGLHAETLAAVERSKGAVAGAVSRALHRVSPKHRTLLALEQDLLDEIGRVRVWCVSDLVRREFLARRPGCEASLEVHANGVDLAAFHPGLREMHRERTRAELGVEAGVSLLLFFGGAWRMKGFDVLLDALARLVERRWVCVAAGDRALQAERAAAAEGLAGRVRAISPRDPRRLYAAADLFVQPTWRDPCSLATLEALACGLPVVTTDANGAGEALPRESDAGEVVPAGDGAALARAIGLRLGVLAVPSAAARRAAETRPRDAWLAGLLESARACAATSRP